jgi:hypothetical protein
MKKLKIFNRHKILFALILLLISPRLISQITFSKYILSPVINYGRAACHSPYGGYVLGADQMSLIRLDDFGNVRWGKTIPNPSGYFLALEDVCISSDSMFLLAGHAVDLSNTLAPHEVFAAKADTSGNLLWISIIDSTSQGVKTIALPSDDGGMIICTTENSTAALGNFHVSFSRFTSTGQLQWHKLIQAVGWQTNFLMDARISGDGNYIASCSFNYTAWILKFDPNGNIIWSTTNNSMPSFVNSPVEIARTTTGMATIDKLNSIFFFDTAGNAITEKQYFNGNGDILIENLLGTSDGGLLAGGRLINNASSSDTLLLFFKTDSVGKVQWARTYDTLGHYYIRDMIETSDGYLINRDFFLTNHHDIYLNKTDLQGHLFCSETDVLVVAQTMTGLLSQNLFYTVSNGQMSLVHPVCISQNKTYADSVHCFVTGIKNETNEEGWTIFPNPTDGIFTMEGLNPNEMATVEIFDVTGKCCNTISFYGKEEINLSTYAPGIYLLRLQVGNDFYSRKIILN